MPHTFDATLKNLSRDYPRAFVSLCHGRTDLPLVILNTDLSAVSTSVDFVASLGDPIEEVVHIEFQSGNDANKPFDMHVANALLYRSNRVPVRSILMLLRPQAMHRNMSGAINYATTDQQSKMEFVYQLVKLWEIPADDFIDGDLGLTPLAPLGKLPEKLTKDEGLASVIHRVVDRLLRESQSNQQKELLVATYLLSGLIITPEKAQELFKGAKAMQESSTYMAILEEGIEKGKAEMLMETILRLGTKRLGKPTPEIEKRLQRIRSRKRLEELTDKILDAKSWDELMAK